MSEVIERPVIHIFKDESVAKSSNALSDWVDTDGFADMTVAFELDDTGTVDANITLYYSHKDAYTLNNEATVDTEDYSTVDIVDAHTGKVYYRVTPDDVEELKYPPTSVAVFIENDEATTATVFNVWLEGRS